ncbi:MAG: hypothetical protein AB2794_03850 [Candidatus Thiodiazotropha endolucinida]
MTTDWKPKTPSARKAFQHRKQEKTKDLKPVTKSALTRLEAQREKPKTGQALVPGGAGQRASDTMNEQREQRIRNIQHRLRRMKNRARDDFDRSR